MRIGVTTCRVGRKKISRALSCSRMHGFLTMECCMKKIVLIAALALAACGQQPQQPYQQAQVQPACNPQISDCYGYGAGRNQHGDAILAGVAGAGLGYAAGRMHANRINERNSYDRDYDRDYDRREYRRQAPTYATAPARTYNTTRSYSPAPVSVTRSAPIVSSRPATRTMFGSARRR
jgi:hypothetical protein